MRRLCMAVAVVLAISLVGGSAWAGAHIQVPQAVTQGNKLEVTVKDCVSGDGFTAIVRVEIYDDDTNELKDTKEVDADDDGTTKVKMKIRASRYPPGRYYVVVTCIHEFDAGGEGVFFESDESFRVRAA